ncbi:Pyridoxal-dependent decarboxylase, pyridoxal binding domain protein [Ostertagia ostertagi]
MSVTACEEQCEEKLKANIDEAFMLVDLDVVFERFLLWKREMPMIEVMDMGVRPEKIIYANPCKTRSFITHAKERNVSMMTFDSVEELAKIAHLHPDANFHVGSGCNDPSAFREALTHARHLIELGRGLGFDMNLVDLGGGYPGTLQQTSFEDIAAVIRSAVDEFLPPGVRFFAAAPFTLVCNIIHATEVSAEKITKRPEDADHRGFMYYVNDGVYGSFNCILFDHVDPVGTPIFDQKMMRMMSVGEWIVYQNMGAYTCSGVHHFQWISATERYLRDQQKELGKDFVFTHRLVRAHSYALII